MTGANHPRDILEVNPINAPIQNLLMRTRKTADIQILLNRDLIISLETVGLSLKTLDTAKIWIGIEKIVPIEIGKGIMIEIEIGRGAIEIGTLRVLQPKIRKTSSYMLTISTIV